MTTGTPLWSTSHIIPHIVAILALATLALANDPRPAVPFFERDQTAYFNGTYGRWTFRAASGPPPDRLDGCVLIEDGTEQEKPWWTRDCKPEIVSWAVAITVIGGLALVCGALSCCFRAYVVNLVRKKTAQRKPAEGGNRDEERGEVANGASSDKLTS